jgi:hypothetical protein
VSFDSNQLYITLNGFAYIATTKKSDLGTEKVSKNITVFPSRRWVWTGFDGYVQTDGPQGSDGSMPGPDTGLPGSQTFQGESLRGPSSIRQRIYNIN